MRKLLLAGAAAIAALVATPALAQTVTPYAQLDTGITDTNIDNASVDYGATLGADVNLNSRLTLGADVNASNVFDNRGRTFGAGARLGYRITPSTLGYVRAGYANLDVGHENLGGLALGGGLNFDILPHTYVNVEYRHTNYEQGVHSNAGLLGLGIRF